ncbi:hypothetical protein GGP41_008473 [Bipolaris sorokiniana]|uniref:Uncharacterized protein n=1 Tax=Cochliobolus sativus TaxID=45130 RepID=A0A8H5ZBA9_COCSA|nr:hypothetical protein GGP41_008473 [Bipolaris sorokiniana]
MPPTGILNKARPHAERGPHFLLAEHTAHRVKPVRSTTAHPINITPLNHCHCGREPLLTRLHQHQHQHQHPVRQYPAAHVYRSRTHLLLRQLLLLHTMRLSARWSRLEQRQLVDRCGL